MKVFVRPKYRENEYKELEVDLDFYKKRVTGLKRIILTVAKEFSLGLAVEHIEIDKIMDMYALLSLESDEIEKSSKGGEDE